MINKLFTLLALLLLTVSVSDAQMVRLGGTTGALDGGAGGGGGGGPVTLVGAIQSWNPVDAYAALDVVVYSDKLYRRSIGGTTPGTPAGDTINWDEVSADLLPISLTTNVSGVLPVANGGTNSSTALNNSRIMQSSGGAIVEGAALADGQMFIGSTGLAPVAATLTGTANQVSVSNGAGSITLSTPQDIHTGASPSFTALTAGNINTAVNTISSTDVNGNIILNPNGTGSINFPDLTSSQPLKLDGSNNVVSADIVLTTDVSGVLAPVNGGTGLDGSSAANGNLLIGNGTGYSLAALTGTANQVSVANGAGSITLSTPQDIHTGASPSFTALTAGNLNLSANTLSSTDVNGNIILNPNGTGNVNLPDLTASQPLKLDGSNNVVASDIVLTSDVTGVLPVASGGTNSSAALNNNRMMISSGGAVVEHGLLSAGSVFFGGATGLLAEDNANLFWNDTNNSLGIGTASPNAATLLDVASTTRGSRPCPPMNQGQRDAIASPVNGLCVFNTTTSTFDVYKSAIPGWESVSATDTVAYPDSLLIGAPSTLDTLQDVIGRTESSGVLSGCGSTDNGDGTVSIATGIALIRSSASSDAPLYAVEVPAQASIALTNNSTNYLYLDYNGGAPQFSVATSLTGAECLDECLTYVISREGTVLNIVDARAFNANSVGKNLIFNIETNGFKHAQGGSSLTETGTRNIGVSAGAFYYGSTRIPHNAFDTSAASTFDHYYRNGVGGFTKLTGQTQISNQLYDDGDGTLGTLGAGNRTVHWVYIINGSPSKLVVQYHDGQFGTLSQAQAAEVPAAPAAIQGTGSLIGRFIIQRNATNFEQIDSAFEIMFSPPFSPDHNELAGLQGGTTLEYYHLTNSAYGNLSTQNQTVRTDSSPTFVNLTLTGLSASQLVKTNGSDQLVSAATISLTSEVAGVLPVASGGTNSSAALNNNRMMVSSGGAVVEHAAQTQGSVSFIGASGLPAQDNANLFYDDTANALGVGTASPDSVAILDVSSTTKGFLPPRMTTVQRDAIVAVAGLMIYNTTINQPQYYNGTGWISY